MPTEAADVDWNITHNIRGPVSTFERAFAPAGRRPTVLISTYPLIHKMAALAPAYETGYHLVVPAQRAIPTELVDASIKHRSRWHYQRANLQAHERQPGSVAVLIDPDGYLTEGTSANIFLVRDGELENALAPQFAPWYYEASGTRNGCQGRNRMPRSESDPRRCPGGGRNLPGRRPVSA